MEKEHPTNLSLLQKLTSSATSSHQVKVCTFNILCDFYQKEKIYSSERYAAQIDLFKREDFDILNLNEFTPEYQALLEADPHFREKYNIVSTLDFEATKFYELIAYKKRKKERELAKSAASTPSSTTTPLPLNNNESSPSPSSTSVSPSTTTTTTPTTTSSISYATPSEKQEFSNFKLGCALLSKYPIIKVNYLEYRAAQASRPALFAILAVPSPTASQQPLRIGVLCVHLKAMEECHQIRASQLRDCFSYLSDKSIKSQCDDMIIMGDWNVAKKEEDDMIDSNYLCFEFKDLWSHLGHKEEDGYTLDGIRNNMIKEMEKEHAHKRNRFDRIVKLIDRQHLKKSPSKIGKEGRRRLLQTAVTPALIAKNIYLVGDQPMYPEAHKQYYSNVNGSSGTNDSSESSSTTTVTDTAPPPKEAYLFLSDHFGVAAVLSINESYSPQVSSTMASSTK